MQCSVASDLALYCLSMSWKKGKSYMGYVTTIIMSLFICRCADILFLVWTMSVFALMRA